MMYLAIGLCVILAPPAALLISLIVADHQDYLHACRVHDRFWGKRDD